MGWKCAGLVVAAVRVRYAYPTLDCCDRAPVYLQAAACAAVVKLDVPAGVFFLSLALCQAGLSPSSAAHAKLSARRFSDEGFLSVRRGCHVGPPGSRRARNLTRKKGTEKKKNTKGATVWWWTWKASRFP